MPRASACFRAERFGDCNTAALTRSMFCGVVTLLAGPLRTDDTFPAVLNAFTQFTTDWRPGTRPRGRPANLKQKARCIAMIEWLFEKYASTQNERSSRVQSMMATGKQLKTNFP